MLAGVVFFGVLLACTVWAVRDLGRVRHPLTLQFLIDASGPGVVAYEIDQTSGRTQSGVVLFHKQGTDISLPLLIYQRWQYVATSPKTDAFSSTQAQQAIATYLASNAAATWNFRGIGPAPTLATRNGSPVLTSSVHDRFDPSGFLCNISLWIFITLGVIAVRKSHRQPQPQTTHCAFCGYDLSGTPSGVCPECGGKRENATPDAASKPAS